MAGAAFATPALADPCEAGVRGYPPGATVSGGVKHVIDGDSLCIGLSRNPKTWTEIRLSDLYAPELHEPGGREAKTRLERQVFGMWTVCTVQPSQSNPRVTYSHDRLIARCVVGRSSIGDLMRRQGQLQGGKGWNGTR